MAVTLQGLAPRSMAAVATLSNKEYPHVEVDVCNGLAQIAATDGIQVMRYTVRHADKKAVWRAYVRGDELSKALRGVKAKTLDVDEVGVVVVEDKTQTRKTVALVTEPKVWVEMVVTPRPAMERYVLGRPAHDRMMKALPLEVTHLWPEPVVARGGVKVVPAWRWRESGDGWEWECVLAAAKRGSHE